MHSLTRQGARTVGMIALTALIAVGCDNSSKDGESDKATASEARSEGVITGTEPGMFGPFKDLKFGMDRAAVEKILPEFFKETKVYGGALVGRATLAAHDDASASVEFSPGLSKIYMTLPGESEAQAIKAWGEPMTVERIGRPVKIWIGATSGMRATLETAVVGDGRSLTVEPYIPFATLADKTTGYQGFVPDAVLGKTPAELLKAFPGVVRPDIPDDKADKMTEELMKDLKADIEKMGVKLRTDGPKLDSSLPSTPYDRSSTLVVLHFDDDNTVRSYTVMVEIQERPAAKDELVAAFNKSWGASKTLKMTLGEQPYWYDVNTRTRATMRVDERQAELSFDRYMPLAELFGAPGVKWGFETTTIIGAPATALADAYKGAFQRKDGDTTATIRFDNTDYDGDTSVTQLLLFLDKKDEVREWRLDLSYRTYPPAKDEIFALAEAKFGAPTIKGDERIFSKSPKILFDDDHKHTKSIDVTVSR